MNFDKTNSQIIEEYRSKFLCINATGDPINLKDFKDKYVVYAIENLTDHKIYIGKTSNLLNRVNHYIWAYRNKDEYDTQYREISKAIACEGIENFRMYPIYIAKNADDMSRAENYYTNALKASRPGMVYNMVEPPKKNERKNIISPGARNHSVETKMKKSKPIIALNPDTKEGYFCNGMKLFGDFVGSSKDQVKNCAKRGIRHHGYYIIYLQSFDRELVSNMRKETQKDYEDWKASHRPNDNKGTHNEYLSYVDLVDQMMSTSNTDPIINAGFKMSIIDYTPANEVSTTTYKIKPFVKDLSEFSDNL